MGSFQTRLAGFGLVRLVPKPSWLNFGQNSVAILSMHAVAIEETSELNGMSVHLILVLECQKCDLSFWRTNERPDARTRAAHEFSTARRLLSNRLDVAQRKIRGQPS